MKHVIWYSNKFGRNDGPPLYYKVAMERMKMNVTHLIPEGDVRRWGDFDYHWWIDWGEDGLPIDQNWQLPEKGKKIYVVSDFHLDEKKYRVWKAKQFDYVFLNQKWFLPEFQKAGVKNVFYLPHAAEPQAYPHFEIIKKWDICFIGHIQTYHKGNTINMTRIDFLDQMFKEFPNFYFGSRNPQWPDKNMFDDAAKKFCQSKVVLNISVGNDWNMRANEVMVSGSFLLTNWIPECKSVEAYGFKDGVHYVSYRTIEEAIQKTKYYIEHDEEREKIAEAGYKQALQTGTYTSRIQEICKTVGISL